MQMRVVSNGICSVKSANSTPGRISALLKRNEIIPNNHVDEEKLKKGHSHVSGQSYNSRSTAASVDCSSHEHQPKSKAYSKIKNYPPGESKDGPGSHNTRASGNNIAPFALKLNHSSSQYRENHHPSLTAQQTRPPPCNEPATLTVARKALEQQKVVSKIAPTNFPPLRAPQSIVDVRHPFVTEARTKHSDTTITNMKSKPDSLQSGIKEIYAGQTFHSYGSSPIASIPSIRSLGNAGIAPYVRTDSYGQAAVANVLFSENAQFPQSPPFSAPPVGQYPTYDPSSYASTPVNPVITQYSAENSIAYPQYESPPQFVQTNHYATSDITNSQYQYQAAGVGQLQESPLFLQSVQSPIAVTEQFAASNYARALRTELIPRLHRPPRFNK